MNHEAAMRAAIEEAKLASLEGEVPVGAVVLCGGRIIARTHNEREKRCDPTAHAEMLALRAAANGGGKIYDCIFSASGL